MNTKNNKEKLVNNSNQIQQEQKIVDKVDKLLLERLPDLISEELDWIREEFGDNKISEFLCGENYYSKSNLLNKIEQIYLEFNIK